MHFESRFILLKKNICFEEMWSFKKTYEDCWTQWIVEIAKFFDILMSRLLENNIYYDFFQIKHITQYFENYVNKRIFVDRTLRERIHFDSLVHKIVKLDKKWVIFVKNKTKNTYIIQFTKLIVINDFTSRQNMLSFFDKEKFDRFILHQEYFEQLSIFSFSKIQCVIVLDETKFSVDIIYALVKTRKKISWIIKKIETNSTFFFSLKNKDSYKNAFELRFIKAIFTLSFSFFASKSWWTKFLHEIDLSRKIVKSIWIEANNETLSFENIKHREKLISYTT